MNHQYYSFQLGRSPMFVRFSPLLILKTFGEILLGAVLLFTLVASWTIHGVVSGSIDPTTDDALSNIIRFVWHSFQ